MDPSKQKDARTVFIRGISFGVDEKALEAVFSDVGPVSKCFLVRQKGSERHQGYGFVQYALAEDAVRAVAELNNKEVGGRKVQVGGWVGAEALWCIRWCTHRECLTGAHTEPYRSSRRCGARCPPPFYLHRLPPHPPARPTVSVSAAPPRLYDLT